MVWISVIFSKLTFSFLRKTFPVLMISLLGFRIRYLCFGQVIEVIGRCSSKNILTIRWINNVMNSKCIETPTTIYLNSKSQVFHLSEWKRKNFLVLFWKRKHLLNVMFEAIDAHIMANPINVYCAPKTYSSRNGHEWSHASIEKMWRK